MLIDVSIYSPISPPRHSVAHSADESLCPSSRPPYVLTQQPLSIRDSLGHGLSHDFGALGGTYSGVGCALNAFSSYANIFHKLVVLVQTFLRPLHRVLRSCTRSLQRFARRCSRTYRRENILVTQPGVGRVWVCSVGSVPTLHTSESGWVS
jgi:hypothetical protein